jgi:hypothetical protein
VSQEIELQRPLRVADLVKYLNECPPDMPVRVSFYTCGNTHEAPLVLERLELRKERVSRGRQLKLAPPYLCIQVEDN